MGGIRRKAAPSMPTSPALAPVAPHAAFKQCAATSLRLRAQTVQTSQHPLIPPAEEARGEGGDAPARYKPDMTAMAKHCINECHGRYKRAVSGRRRHATTARPHTRTTPAHTTSHTCHTHAVLPCLPVYQSGGGVSWRDERRLCRVVEEGRR